MGSPGVNPLPTTVPGKGSGSPSPAGETKEQSVTPPAGSAPKQEDKQTTQDQAKNAVTNETLQSRIDRSRMVEGQSTEIVKLSPQLQTDLYELLKTRVEGLRGYKVDLQGNDRLLINLFDKASGRAKTIEELKKNGTATGEEHLFTNEQELALVLDMVDRELIEFVSALGHSSIEKGERTMTFTLPDEATFLHGGTPSKPIGPSLAERIGAKFRRGEKPTEFTLHFGKIQERFIANRYVEGAFLSQSDEIRQSRLNMLAYTRQKTFESLGVDFEKTENLALKNLSPESLVERNSYRVHNLIVNRMEAMLTTNGQNWEDLTDYQRIDLNRQASELGVWDFCEQECIEAVDKSKDTRHRTDRLDQLESEAKERGKQASTVTDEQIEAVRAEKAAQEAEKKHLEKQRDRIDQIEAFKGEDSLYDAQKKLTEAQDAYSDFINEPNPTTGTATPVDYEQYAVQQFNALKPRLTTVENELTQTTADEKATMTAMTTAKKKYDQYRARPTNTQIRQELVDLETDFNLSEKSHQTALDRIDSLKKQKEEIKEEMRPWEEKIAQAKGLAETMSKAERTVDALTTELAALKTAVGNTPIERSRNISQVQSIIKQIEATEARLVAVKTQATGGPEEKPDPVRMKIVSIFKYEYPLIMARFGTSGDKRIDIEDLSNADPQYIEQTYDNWLKGIFESNGCVKNSIDIDKNIQTGLLPAFELAREIEHYTGRLIVVMDPAGNPITDLQDAYNTARENLYRAQKILQDKRANRAPEKEITAAERAFSNRQKQLNDFQIQALSSVVESVASLSRPQLVQLVENILDHRLNAALSGNPFAESIYEAPKTRETITPEAAVFGQIGNAEINPQAGAPIEKGARLPVKVEYQLDESLFGGTVKVEMKVNDIGNTVDYNFRLQASQTLFDSLPLTRAQAELQGWKDAVVKWFYGSLPADQKRSSSVDYKFIEVSRGTRNTFEEAIREFAGNPGGMAPNPYVELNVVIPSAITDSVLSKRADERKSLLGGFSLLPLTIAGQNYQIAATNEGNLVINGQPLDRFLAEYGEMRRKQLNPPPAGAPPNQYIPLNPAQRIIIADELREIKSATGEEILRILPSKRLVYK
ncbi:hypothetical protein HYT02_04200 [Candidatus Gottesmanbacteria bacterium]|nr:hypothetical protein [Candidatus Gottesmanbacteria bacterium]